VSTTAAPTTVAPTSVRPTTAPSTTRPQSTSSSSTTSTTEREAETTTTVKAALLVPGPNDTSPQGDGTGTDDGLSSATKLRLIVAGLVVIALVILALTVMYWRHTRPWDDEWDETERPDGQGAPGDGAAPDRVPAAVAGAAGATAEDPGAASRAAALDALFAPETPGPVTVAVGGPEIGPPTEPVVVGAVAAAGASALGGAAREREQHRDQPTEAVSVEGAGDRSPGNGSGEPTTGGGLLDPAPLAIVTLEDLSRDEAPDDAAADAAGRTDDAEQGPSDPGGSDSGSSDSGGSDSGSSDSGSSDSGGSDSGSSGD
jgi:uncharacterized membrane protein YgcG